jgi:hypothetical protein
MPERQNGVAAGTPFIRHVMSRQIVIEFDFDTDKPLQFSHALDFNESLFRLACTEESISYSREHMDRASTQVVRVKSARRLRRALAKIEKLIEDHGLTGIARLTVVVPPN